MLILAHRGYWKSQKEKNTPDAFRRAFDSGFGIELDVRDYCGKLVVSHDMPGKKAMDLSRLFKLKAAYKSGLPLAINVKADGLQSPLLKFLREYKVRNYFVFDMSIPDALGYAAAGIKMFTRQSDFEREPALYTMADGVWMDEFKRHWISAAHIRRHLRQGKKVCLVSPELHRRRHLAVWEEYKDFLKKWDTDRLMICTDFPEEARRFFYE